MNKPHMWTIEETEFLRQNYASKGFAYCQEHLKLPYNSIMYKAQKENLKQNPDIYALGHTRPIDRCKIDVGQFIKLDKKEVIYFLGYFWADGYLAPNYRLYMKIQEKDFNNIEATFDLLGKWNKSRYKPRKSSWQPTGSFSTTNRYIYKILQDYNYNCKEIGTNIINDIPEHLLKYWYRGYLDGDGCIIAQKSSFIKNAICFSGPFNQNWDFLNYILQKLNINKFSIKRITTNKGHNSSSLTITKRLHVAIFLDYIYKDYDNIGLTRKYEKYIFLKQFLYNKYNKIKI